MAVILLSGPGTRVEAEDSIGGEELHRDFRIRAQESWVGRVGEGVWEG